MDSIFITGAGSGIGRATAQFFAARGWFIGAYDIDARGLSETMRGIDSTRSVSGVFDVCDAAAWRENVLSFGARTDGAMRVLFNNAGIARIGRFEDISESDSARIVDVNLKGVINGCYAALTILRRTPHARIINVASAAALYGAPRIAVYSATKHAVRGLTEALALEFAPYGVGVSSLMPWFVDTPLVNEAPDLRRNLENAGAPIYPARDVAAAAWRAAHGRRLHYLVGDRTRDLASAARFLPGLVRSGMRKTLMRGG